jgi:hypothetical protein
MRNESLPSVQEIYHMLENAALDLYGFAVVCHNGATWMAEPDLLDALLLGLENHWFTDTDGSGLNHKEFRLELFQAVWEKCKDKNVPVRVGTDVPLGHEEMAFYQLPQFVRAALFLRTHKRMSYAAIAMALKSSEGLVRDEVERAREFLLGRRLKAVEWTEEDF